MRKRAKLAYEEAARKAAEITHVDENLRRAFLKGVAWTAEHFRRKLQADHWESHPCYPTKFMENLTLKDMRETIDEFMKADYVEDDDANH